MPLSDGSANNKINLATLLKSTGGQKFIQALGPS
jgi:hypothetical protein